MRSMTGYGRGEAARHGFKFTVELNSINRKLSDISINLAKELVELEPRIRDEIKSFSDLINPEAMCGQVIRAYGAVADQFHGFPHVAGSGSVAEINAGLRQPKLC